MASAIDNRMDSDAYFDGKLLTVFKTATGVFVTRTHPAIGVVLEVIGYQFTVAGSEDQRRSFAAEVIGTSATWLASYGALTTVGWGLALPILVIGSGLTSIAIVRMRG